MDCVYFNGQISIGLCQATLEQRHLYALLLVFESSIVSKTRRPGLNPLRKCNSLQTEMLAEALSIIATDRWNRCAWILQEAFVKADNMILLLPQAKEIDVEGWSLICHDLSLSEIGIKLDMFQSCIYESTAFLIPKPGSSLPVKLPKWAEALERLAWIHPEPSGWL